jgi:hypothetical protein
VTGFVEPATGRTVWNIANAVCKEMFELILVDFAKSVGAGADKRIVLQLDNAGWHGPNAVPDGDRLVYQPAHSLELQPAEHLWAFVLANRCFASRASIRGRTTLPGTHTAVRYHPQPHPPLVALPASQDVISRSRYYSDRRPKTDLAKCPSGGFLIL